MKGLTIVTAVILLSVAVNAQEKNAGDANLHNLQPAYTVPYGAMSKDDIKKVLDKVFSYLDGVTPAQMLNKSTNEPVAEVAKIDSNTIVQQGDFRITSYEWGVTYSAMLYAGEITGDKKFTRYVQNRFNFLATWIPAVKKLRAAGIYGSNMNFPLRQPIEPKALDDAGAVCAAMIKATIAGVSNNLRPQIDNYIDWVANKEYRLSDGTLARNRPLKNTLWLDDMYMGIPALAQMGKLTGDKKYFDDAVNQIKQFSQRMFIKEKGVYMHGWVESMETHPEFKWARANGWALMATVELLDALPENHPGRAFVLQQLKAHVKGLAAYQSGSGFWHQLLDREDSYLETSATAIYSYCIAHACNKGWLDPYTYGPMAMLAWNAVTTKVNDKGQVEGTCVGTGMAFDPAFYYHRPVSVLAAHGYGPLILAGTEMYKMADQNKIIINDGALHLQDHKN